MHGESESEHPDSDGVAHDSPLGHWSNARSLGGGAVIAAIITGTAALVLGVFSVAFGRFEATGVALLAAAVSFVGVANVIFRR
jgi:hypothetical protein